MAVGPVSGRRGGRRGHVLPQRSPKAPGGVLSEHARGLQERTGGRAARSLDPRAPTGSPAGTAWFRGGRSARAPRAAGARSPGRSASPAAPSRGVAGRFARAASEGAVPFSVRLGLTLRAGRGVPVKGGRGGRQGGARRCRGRNRPLLGTEQQERPGRAQVAQVGGWGVLPDARRRWVPSGRVSPTGRLSPPSSLSLKSIKT